MSLTTAVERVEVTEENLKKFKMFTNQVVGRGLSIPDDNLLFFGYRVNYDGLVKLLVCAGTCRPALTGPVHSSGVASPGTGVDHCCADLATLNLTSSEAGVADSDSPASSNACTTNKIDEFLDDSSHVVEYLFTDPYYRKCGYGGKVLDAMETHCKQLNPEAPFKLWAAAKARNFFQRRHYAAVSQAPYETSTSINIFKTLYPMVKRPDAVGRELPTSLSRQRGNRNRRRRKGKNTVSPQ